MYCIILSLGLGARMPLTKNGLSEIILPIGYIFKGIGYITINEVKRPFKSGKSKKLSYTLEQTFRLSCPLLQDKKTQIFIDKS